MKRASFKVFALVLAICCIATLIPLITFADGTNPYEVGSVFKKDDDSILLTANNRLDDNTAIAEPGENIYVVIREYDPTDYKSKVKSMKITAEDSDSKVIVANQSLSETIILKDENGKRYECAVIPTKFISINKFKEDSEPLEYIGTFVAKFKEAKSTGETHDDVEVLINFGAGYADGSSSEELKKTPARFELYKEDEPIFTYSGNDGNDLSIETTVTADNIAILSCDNDALDEIEEIFGNFAELTYYNLHGTLNRVKNTKIIIENVEELGRYLYRYQGGVLYDMSYCYKGEEDDTFEVRISGTSVELCTYIVSNYELDLSKSPILEGSETVIYEEPTEPSTTRADAVVPNSTIPVIYGKIDDTPTTSRVTPSIPNTGAVC